jgi:hypothetical protein
MIASSSATFSPISSGRGSRSLGTRFPSRVFASLVKGNGTSPWEAGIEENTYLAYVFAKWPDYAVAACSITDSDERGKRAKSNLLTGEEKEHIIDSKGRCGPGEPSWQSLSRLSPWTVRSRSLSPSSRAR